MTYTLTTLFLVAVAFCLLVRSRGQIGSFTRSLGFGFLFTPVFLWFGFGRYIIMTWYQVPFVSVLAALFTGALVHLGRLPRRFGPNPERGDILDLAVDKLIDVVLKR
ncbi:MAG TPA: hypothetical protein VNT75_11870 [Symbiobacteriaceae bacterium]|nr:hypothetical protein [Symbiobacteriaceae bacterium]